MADIQQLIGSLPDDWRIRVVLGSVALVCYVGMVYGLSSFISFGTHDDV